MLCDKCRCIDFTTSPLMPNSTPQYSFVTISEIDDEEGPEYHAYPHHQNLEALFDASDNGCHFCSLIRQGLFHLRGHESDEAHHNGPVEIRYYVKATHRADLNPRELQVVAKTPMRDVKVRFDLAQYSPFLTDLLEQKSLKHHQTTGCEENFKLAIIWLDKCLKTHALCTISTPPYPTLPSRILDVQCPTSASSLSLCSSKGRHGPYITLSHVWGHVQIITTTLSTFPERTSSILISDLSNTFRDAVELARQLSIRYLWIDSLCIIQDSAEDWRAESSKMGEYYSNALLNIAAVSASDGNEGCFMKRDVLHVTPCPVSIKFPPSIPTADSQIFISLSMGWDPVDEIQGFQRPPLWQRAWVVQERLLSTRTLHFSSVQMSWKCRVAEASERVPEIGKSIPKPNIRDDILQHTLAGLQKFVPQFQASGGGTVTADLLDLYNAWYDLVTLYGKCALTKPSDIFPAISGIARAIALSINDRYISGLWYQDLHRGLLWSAPDSTASKPDLRDIRAPSWSWASMQATANFYVRQISQRGLKVQTDMFEITGFGERTSGVDTFGGFGEVEEVILSVSGVVKRAHPVDLDDEMTFKKMKKMGNETLFDLRAGLAVGYYFPDNIDRRYLTEIWCTPVMTEENARSKVERDGETLPGPPQARCLALLRLSEDREIYMRVGSAWILDYSWFSDQRPSSFAIT